MHFIKIANQMRLEGGNMNALSGSLNMSVLICSSSRPLQQSLAALLDAMGCAAVAAAESVAAAREQLDLQHHDLALVDDSFEAAQHELAALSVPSLRLTNRSEVSGESLLKPFRPEDLASRMHARVQRRDGDALAATS